MDCNLLIRNKKYTAMLESVLAWHIKKGLGRNYPLDPQFFFSSSTMNKVIHRVVN